MENARKVKLFGDRQEALRKYGQGQALLRASKAISELLGIPYYRLFSADKQVIAQSISGVQDQIILNAPEILKPEEEIEPYCNINFINLPEEIPPMKWYAPGQETWEKIDDAWIIKDPNGVIEIEGVDYIKTYYTLNITDCNECSGFISTVCKTEELFLARCHPYNYDATKLLYRGGSVPYFQGWPERVPPVPPDPENHLIYSFYEYGQAEILKFDHDNQGSYFLWKAYTEWGSFPPTDITFSKTGLGYLLLKAFILFEGMELCKKEAIVKVDCCLKPLDARKVEIWWEDFGTCQPYIIYPGVVYNSLCKMPTEVPSQGTNSLNWYGNTHPYQPLYAIPEINGSCLPVEWSFVGPITFRGNSKKNDNTIYFQLGEIACNESIFIRLKDRCGSSYEVRGSPCCENAAPLYISYTTLQMSCNQQQTLYAMKGCGPYSWALIGGGGSLSPTEGMEVVYTSPATNPNCTSNPTIQVTDCCGSTASIQLAVNCYTGSGTAFCWDDQEECVAPYWENDMCKGGIKSYIKTYYCDGTLKSDYVSGCQEPAWVVEASDCHTIVDEADCLVNWLLAWKCPCSGNPPCGPLMGCVGWHDQRTQAMKDAGCCPINPETGLPY